MLLSQLPSHAIIAVTLSCYYAILSQLPSHAIIAVTLSCYYAILSQLPSHAIITVTLSCYYRNIIAVTISLHSLAYWHSLFSPFCELIVRVVYLYLLIPCIFSRNYVNISYFFLFWTCAAGSNTDKGIK